MDSADTLRLERVRAACEQFEQQLTNFSNLVKDKVEQEQNSHSAAIQHEKENHTTLNKVEEQTKQKISQLHEKHEMQKATLEASSNKLYELKEQCQAIPHELSKKRQQMLNTQQQLDKQNQLHDEAIKEKEYKTNELSLGRDFYRKYLGLDFQRIEEDRLRFVFNNIDPDDHARQFSFCVFINEKNKYQVHDCTPSLSGMASMIDQLNASNNFSAFVQQVRAKFRDLALRGADQHDVDAPAATMDNN